MSAWRSWALALALAALAVVYSVALRAPAVGTFHDDGVYLVTAKALAEGKGYRIISLPSEIPQTKYPPLFPLLLAGVWKLNPHFPHNVVWLKLVPLCCTALWLWLSFHLLREEGAEKWTACWVCCLTAASTWVVYLGTMVMSEAPFAALTTASLLLFRRAERQESMRLLLAAAACAALAFHTRSLGVALIVAGPLYLAIRGKWRQSALFALTAGLLAAPWIWWVFVQPLPLGPVDAYYSKENYQGWNILSNFTLSQKLDILFSNLAVILFAPGMMAGIPVKDLFVLPSLALGVACLVGMWRKRRSPIVLLLLVYGAMVCAWAWLPTRFVSPFLPLLLWLAVETLSRRPRSRAWAMALLTVASIGSLAYAMHKERTMRLGHPPLPIPVAAGDTWQKLESLLQEARQTTPANAVFMGNLDPVYYLLTGRKAVRGFAAEPYRLMYGEQESPQNPLGGAERVYQGIRDSGASYWVDTPNSSFSEGIHLKQVLGELMRKYPRSFEQRTAVSGAHVLYRLRLAPETLLGGTKDQGSPAVRTK